ncbi:MAG: hypothetical protein AAF938_18675 [Myxococcota bacterium]
MRTLIIAALLTLSSLAHARCLLVGSPQTLTTEVHAGDETLRVEAFASEWEGVASGTRARFEVRTYLRFRSRAPLDSLGIALREPRDLWDLAEIPHRHEFAFESPRAVGRHIRGTALIGRRSSNRRMALEGRRIPCAWLAITTAAMRRAYDAGFRREPAVDEAGTSAYAQWLAGQQDSRLQRRVPPSAMPGYARERLRIFSEHVGQRSVWIRPGSAQVWTGEERGSRIRIFLVHGNSTAVGWARRSDILPLPAFGRGEGGFQGRSERLPRVGPRHLARLPIGTEVFATPGDAGSRWAHVHGEGQVEIEPTDEPWTRLTVIPGIRVDDHSAWVRARDIEEHVYETPCGVFVPIGTTHQPRFRVHRLPPASMLPFRGVAVGDEIRDPHVVRCQRLPQTLWVWRGGRAVALRERE